MSLGMDVGVSPRDFVLVGAPVPHQSPQKWGAAPKFSTHVYCDQTARCIKMPLGMEIVLSPGDFVLEGDPAPYHKMGGDPSNFWPTSICDQTDAWIKMPLGTEVGLGLRDIVFDIDPATPRKRAHPPLPNFWPMSIVAKWLDG